MIFIAANAYGHPVWSNFEIADMDFWRSEPYQAFFDFLESKGGFYYEVKSLAFLAGVYSNVIGSDGETRLCIR